MKGSALIMALGKPGSKAPSVEVPPDAEGGGESAKADLGIALQELQSATTPEAMAEAFLSALELADSCKAGV
jgi:hypothetical protein